MQKTVYFYQVDLCCSNSEEEQAYTKIPELLISIINEKAKIVSNFKVLDFSSGDSHQVVDIFDYEGDYLFMRASQQRRSASFLLRDYEENKPKAVLEDEKKSGIEKYTYLFYNYGTGILAIVNSQGAPTYKVMNQFFTFHNTKYFLKFIHIPNANGIEEFYESKKMKLTQMEIELPVPKAGLLEQLFGWDDRQILDAQNGRLKATIKISGMERRIITEEKEKTQRILSSLIEKLENYNKATVKLKVDDNNIQSVSFLDAFFKYPIDISFFTDKEGERIYYTPDELLPFFKSKIMKAYDDNKETLRGLTNRN